VDSMKKLKISKTPYAAGLGQLSQLHFACYPATNKDSDTYKCRYTHSHLVLPDTASWRAQHKVIVAVSELTMERSVITCTMLVSLNVESVSSFACRYETVNEI